MTTVHLHRDDVPDTLALLGVLLGDRSKLPEGNILSTTGADIDWDLLLGAGFPRRKRPWCTSPTGAPCWNATAADCPLNCVPPDCCSPAPRLLLIVARALVLAVVSDQAVGQRVVQTALERAPMTARRLR